MNEHTAENDAPYRALLGLMLENVHIGVSNEDIVVDTQRFPAPANLRAALVRLMDEWMDGEATRVIPPGTTDDTG